MTRAPEPGPRVGTDRLLPSQGERDAFAREPEQEPVVVGDEPVFDRDVEFVPVFGEHPGDGRDARARPVVDADVRGEVARILRRWMLAKYAGEPTTMNRRGPGPSWSKKSPGLTAAS